MKMDSGKRWIKVTLKVADVDPQEAAGALAWAMEAALEVEDDGDGAALIHIWAPDKPGALGQDAADTLRNLFPDAKVALEAVTAVEDQDWLAEWRKSVTPVELGERILVIPTFNKAPENHGREVVILDPGMAFGSGHHPSTRLCAEALEKYIGPKALDIGCGSGILAIIAARLGARRTLAVDVDPVAAMTARDNVTQNGDGARIGVAVCGPEGVGTTFDIITANIFLNAHLSLAGQYWRLAAPGGRLIVSGLRTEQAEAALAGLAGAGFHLLERRDMGEWTALVLEKPFQINNPVVE